MEILLIKDNSPEYNYMWGWLADHPINKDLEEPMVALNGEEAWQYMGSYRLDSRVVHEFRHRNHPSNNDRIELKVSGSSWMTEDDIELATKMK